MPLTVEQVKKHLYNLNNLCVLTTAEYGVKIRSVK